MRLIPTSLAAVLSFFCTFSFAAVSSYDHVGCLIAEDMSGGYAARYFDPKTWEQLESIEIPAKNRPIIERAKGGRGKVRSNCADMIIRSLGQERANRIFEESRR